MYNNVHLSLIHWSCSLKLQTFFPKRFRIVWSWTQVTSLLALTIRTLWWIAESYHGPQSTWSINMLYKILMIHDQHSISLVEYAFDARRWAREPLHDKMLRFQSTLTSAMLRMKLSDTISLFQPEAGYASWEYMWLPKPRGALGGF